MRASLYKGKFGQHEQYDYMHNKVFGTNQFLTVDLALNKEEVESCWGND